MNTKLAFGDPVEVPRRDKHALGDLSEPHITALMCA